MQIARCILGALSISLEGPFRWNCSGVLTLLIVLPIFYLGGERAEEGIRLTHPPLSLVRPIAGLYRCHGVVNNAVVVVETYWIHSMRYYTTAPVCVRLGGKT